MTATVRTEFQVERTLLTQDGIRLHAGFAPERRDWASSMVVVMVHGFNASISTQPNLAVLQTLTERHPVVAVELRGHGSSQGRCTLGHKEIHDVAAAVRWARTLGFDHVVTVGFSMGASIVVRHAGLVGGIDAAVAVSGAAFWNYRGTPIMRRLYFGVENPLGRQVVARVLGTRVIAPPWPQPLPESPEQAARRIAPLPFLVVHGTRDGFFPQDHPQALRHAVTNGARQRGVPDNGEIWLRPFGHAEAAIPADLVRQISEWVDGVAGRLPQ